MNELNVLTDEGERGGEDEEHAIAVHGECDSKVGGQTAPHKKLVHCCPVMGVEAQLEKFIHSINVDIFIHSVCYKIYIISPSRVIYYNSM